MAKLDTESISFEKILAAQGLSRIEIGVALIRQSLQPRYHRLIRYSGP